VTDSSPEISPLMRDLSGYIEKVNTPLLERLPKNVIDDLV